MSTLDARREMSSLLWGMTSEPGRFGYKAQPKQLLEQALAIWDWALCRVRLASSVDITLLKLAKPITGIAPAPMFNGDSALAVKSAKLASFQNDT
jgi:hypothetical protein